ncbi:MAG: AraC family ligand binding domain-containing protein [Polaribacter sp.]|uniref:AraC family ligand binding domain-containing protein n=1 Tax=Polaribacter sp. TaxID=1920175 RepID=UPI002F35F0C0
MKVASFLEDVKFNSNKPSVLMLMDTDFSKELRVVFKKGQIMEDHQAPFAIVVQVIKGAIDFGANEELIQLNDGDLVSLKPHIVHNLSAAEDSVVRLTLSKADSLQRVKNV